MAKKNVSGNSLLRNNKVILAGIGLLLAFVFIGTLTFLKGFYQTETYYVLNDEQGETIPARTLLDESMLTPLVIAEGTAPPNLIPLATINDNYIYTKYALKAGDVITESNAGSVDNIYTGVPDNWVITNFSVGADDAVGGRVRVGSYFDVLVADEAGSFYPFVNVLALDTTVDMSSAENAEAADTAAAYKGQTTQYVVAMEPGDAARLHQVVAKYAGKLKLVLSPKQNEYHKPQLASYSDLFVFSGTSPIWPGKSNEGEITDSQFSSVPRNKAGEPLERVKPRNDGNLRSDERVDISKNAAHPDPATDSSTTTEDESAPKE